MSQHTAQTSNGTVAQTVVVAQAADLAVTAWAVPASTTRRVVEFYNNGAGVVYVSTSNVAATAIATGRPIAAGASWSDSATGVAWFVFTASSTAEVRINNVEKP